MISQVIDNLKKNNMNGFFVNNAEELLECLTSLIPEGSTIGCGDSVTLEDAGVFDYLRSGTYDFYDKHKPGLTSAEKREIYLNNFRADIFISGTNAITLDGKLFNIDGNGSRVAPMLYGPEQVIVVVGKNKIVKDVNAAIKRTRQLAAPLDAKRLNKNTPCTSLEHCIDCRHKERICNDFVLIARQFNKDRIKVIIVDEAFGY